MDTNEEIGLRIKQARLECGMTLQDIADEIGVVKSTIQRYENGKIEKIKLPVIEAIARTIHVNAAWILGKSKIKDTTHTLEARTDIERDKCVTVALVPHEVKVITSYRSQPDMQKSVDRILGIEEEPEIEPAPEPKTIAKEQETPEEEEEYVEVFSAAMSNPDAKGGYATPGMIKMKKSDVEKLLNAPETKRNF